MRHHFGDFLPRDKGYWAILPNRERHGCRIGDTPVGSPEVTVVTIGKDDVHWIRALTFPNLVEVTLHQPTHEQLLAMAKLKSIKRLRITHARPTTLDFICALHEVEELVLEYVSGVNDLAPLRHLPKLRALHLENLRGITNFGGLSGLNSLKYLAIYGTTDWKQPILDFEFLRGLPELEMIAFWEVRSEAPYPAFYPALSLKKLKMLRLHGSYFAPEEYALLEEGLASVEGANWGPFRTVAYSRIELPAEDPRAKLPSEMMQLDHPEVVVHFDGRRTIAAPGSQWFEFTGKGAGKVKCGGANADSKCSEYAKRYAAMKVRARTLIGPSKPD